MSSVIPANVAEVRIIVDISTYYVNLAHANLFQQITNDKMSNKTFAILCVCLFFPVLLRSSVSLPHRSSRCDSNKRHHHDRDSYYNLPLKDKLLLRHHWRMGKRHREGKTSGAKLKVCTQNNKRTKKRDRTQLPNFTNMKFFRTVCLSVCLRL